jgi:hypothetical protein
MVKKRRKKKRTMPKYKQTPEIIREVKRLRFLQYKNYREIGEELGISKTLVATILASADENNKRTERTKRTVGEHSGSRFASDGQKINKRVVESVVKEQVADIKKVEGTCKKCGKVDLTNSNWCYDDFD